jgi:thiol-disulfide isomerase/thioredoxin
MRMVKILFIIFLAAEIILPIDKTIFAAKNEPKIKVVTKDVDLGQVGKNETYDFKIEVKNMGTEDLVIINVASSCGCLELTDKRWATNAIPAPVTITKGNSIYISAKVDTNKVGGEFEKTIHIFSNDPDKKDAVWTVKGKANTIPTPISAASAEMGGRTGAKMVMVFYSPGCNECREIMDKFLPRIQQKYKDKIMVVDYNIENIESYAFMLSLQDKYDERSKGGFYNPKPPVLFIENRLLYGVKEIKNNLESLI